MFDLDKWQEIFGTIRRHKLRTILTAFSVWWGIFMLVILLGAGKGMENSVRKNFEDDAINTLFIWPDQTSEAYKGLPAGRQMRFDNEDYESVAGQEGIVHSSGRFFLWGSFFITYQNKSLSFDVRCVHPDFQIIEVTKVINGRFINETDITQKRKVCIIGALVRDGFFDAEEDPIGKYIKIKNIDYKVVGIFEDSGDDRVNRQIFVPISTAQRIEGTDRVHNILLEMGDATLEEALAMEENVRQHLANRLKFSPTDQQAIHIFNKAKEFQEIQLVLGFIKGFIWFVGIGSIVAGVIGVSNIMLIIIKDRTKEIGIRKALGATPSSIVSMIVQESIFLTSVAGYFGLACGLGVIFSIQRFMEVNQIESEFFYNPEVNMGMVMIALLILIISGALAGLIPALQAVKVNPMEAMKG